MRAVNPSGRQVEIVHGGHAAVVAEVGGGLRTYRVGDHELLDGYRQDEMCRAGRGQVLAPWPNRLEDGSYEFDGQQHELPINEREAHNAIHGLVRWARWTVAAHDTHRTVLEHMLHPQPGYPFSLALRVEYELSDRGLSVATTATNLGPTACPYGSGQHPYFRPYNGAVDELMVRVPADRMIESDRRGLPVRTRPVDDTAYDFRVARRVNTTILDHAFYDLERDPDGRARIELRVRDDQGATVWLDRGYTHVMVFTGDSLPDISRRSIAIEPMTCAPNAFRSGTGLIRLAPGESSHATWGVEPTFHR